MTYVEMELGTLTTSKSCDPITLELTYLNFFSIVR